MERDADNGDKVYGTCDFNSHAHVERDHETEVSKADWCNFNSHAHVEREKRHRLHRPRHIHFNSHAHVERDSTLFAILSLLVISTHTLTWSVTMLIRHTIHNLSFQLTRSRGAWPAVWRCTVCCFDFNSHAHVERDLSSPVSLALPAWFQLTRSRGAWRCSLNLIVAPMNFNSHAHVERDLFIYVILAKTHIISTHTLTWSVTCCYGTFTNYFLLFQLTRSRGAWLYSGFATDTKYQDFNSHAHVERDISTNL